MHHMHSHILSTPWFCNYTWHMLPAALTCILVMDSETFRSKSKQWSQLSLISVFTCAGQDQGLAAGHGMQGSPKSGAAPLSHSMPGSGAAWQASLQTEAILHNKWQVLLCRTDNAMHAV